MGQRLEPVLAPGDQDERAAAAGQLAGECGTDAR